jgi:hypothetical protein
LSVISGARIWIEGWTSVDALPCVALAVTKALQWVLICSVVRKISIEIPRIKLIDTV